MTAYSIFAIFFNLISTAIALYMVSKLFLKNKALKQGTRADTSNWRTQFRLRLLGVFVFLILSISDLIFLIIYPTSLASTSQEYLIIVKENPSAGLPPTYDPKSQPVGLTLNILAMFSNISVMITILLASLTGLDRFAWLNIAVKGSRTQLFVKSCEIIFTFITSLIAIELMCTHVCQAIPSRTEFCISNAQMQGISSSAAYLEVIVVIAMIMVEMGIHVSLIKTTLRMEDSRERTRNEPIIMEASSSNIVPQLVKRPSSAAIIVPPPPRDQRVKLARTLRNRMVVAILLLAFTDTAVLGLHTAGILNILPIFETTRIGNSWIIFHSYIQYYLLDLFVNRVVKIKRGKDAMISGNEARCFSPPVTELPAVPSLLSPMSQEEVENQFEFHPDYIYNNHSSDFVTTDSCSNG